MIGGEWKRAEGDQQSPLKFVAGCIALYRQRTDARSTALTVPIFLSTVAGLQLSTSRDLQQANRSWKQGSKIAGSM